MAGQTESVVYEMNIKDGLTPALSKADKEAKHLEEDLVGIKEKAVSVFESIGFGFAVFEGLAFVREAKESWEELEFANSQLEAGLESTEHQAGLTFDELQKGALELSHNLKFTQAQVEDMQSILLTFPAVTKSTFNDASLAVLNMATRLGTDAKGAAIQLGKALQDPVQGLSALHRVGVNVEDLQKKFVHITSTLERQKLIIAELNSEFGGSAESAAKADVSFRFEKSMQELKVTIGELADQVSAKLAPAFEWFVNEIKDAVEWGKKHAELIKAIGYGILAMAAAWGIYKASLLALVAVEKLQAFWEMAQLTAMVSMNVAQEELTIGTKLVTAAQYAWNVAITANPIGLIIVAIGALVASLIYCYNHFAKFRAVLWGTWAVIKEFASLVSESFDDMKHIIHGVFTLDWTEIKKAVENDAKLFNEQGKRLSDAFKTGYNNGLADFAADHKEEDKSLMPKGTAKAKQLGNGKAVKDPDSKATPSKVNTFYITIHDLIGTQNTNVTNIKEGSKQIRDLLVSELTSAVNDFQVVADH